MILEKTIQEIRETARVEDVISEYVNLKRRGVNLIGLCPFHNEKTPSFIVSPTKNIFKCFGCGQAGDSIKFLMEHDHLSYPEALKYLAAKYGIKVEEEELSPEKRAQQQVADSLFLVNQFALEFYQKQMMETDMGKSVGLSYFKQRGFREDTIKKFGLGYAPDAKDRLTLTAQQQSYNIELLKKLGLTSRYGSDFFRNRVMFPIHNLSGKVVAFAGRIMAKDVKAPKYVNSPETEVYHKSKILYAANFAKAAIRKQNECILVEGYTDVISLHQEGIENVVASSGTSLTTDQIRLIKRFTPNVKILFDGDAAGIKAALRGVDMLLKDDLNIKIVILPDGEDPDSYLNKVGVNAFKEYINSQAKDFILFKAKWLLEQTQNDPVGRSGVIKDIVVSIGMIPDPIKRSIFVKECAQLFGVEEKLLVNETNKALSIRIKKEKQEREVTARRLERERQRAKNDLVGDFPTEAPPVTDADFPDAEPPYLETEDFPAEKPPEEAPSTVVTGNEFQEKDIVRILIEFGHKELAVEETPTVAHYILANIEDVIEDFDNGLYLSIVKEVQQLLNEGKDFDTAYFINHTNPKVATMAINLITSPYEYSENWAKKDVFLSQKDPSENFIKDSEAALMRFRLQKITKICENNKEKIKELAKKGSEEELVTFMKVQQKLIAIRNELADKLGTVIVK